MAADTVVVPPLPGGPRVTAFFTTKRMNGDLDAVARLMQVPVRDVYLPIQKHTDKVVVLDFGREPRIADAVITHRTAVVIGVQVADCVPILLYDPQRRVAGAVHAGWRGTAEMILKKTIEAMAARFSSSPADIMVAVGPSIKGCCYEVGPEVAEAVEKATGSGAYCGKRGEKYHLDLPEANRLQALSMGVLPEQVWVSGDCTFCLPDKYFSYRFSKGSTGRQCAFIAML
ncbi:MAG: peptidoglycan editing factor PgeF [Nitrospirota bacterium]